MAKKPSKAPELSFEDLKKLAFDGAQATIARLRHEVAILERTFPELATSKGRARVVASAEKTTRQWTEASRKAVSARMKKYWAVRKRAEKK